MATDRLPRRNCEPEALATHEEKSPGPLVTGRRIESVPPCVKESTMDDEILVGTVGDPSPDGKCLAESASGDVAVCDSLADALAWIIAQDQW